MSGKFAANLAFLLFVNLITKPFAVFVDIEVQNTVGPDTFGLYFAVFNLSVLFHMILDFGINNFNNRSVAQDKAHIQEFLPSVLVVKTGLAFVYLAITGFVAYVSGFEVFQLELLAWMALNQILLSLILFLRSNVSGLHLFRLDSLLSVLDKVLLIIFTAALLWGGIFDAPFRIEWYIYAQTGAFVITAFIAFTVVLLKAGKLHFSVPVNKMKQLLRQAAPYALLGVLMSVYYRVDGVMIERMLPIDGNYQAGAYAAAYRLFDAANILGLLFAAILLPMFARLIKERTGIQSLLSLSYKGMFVAATLIVTLGWFYREPIMSTLYHSADGYWYSIWGLLIMGYIGAGTVYIFGSLLTANGSLRILNIMALSAALLNIVLNLVLIPEYKAYGATIATVITQLLVALAHVEVGRRVFHLRINTNLLFRMFLFAASVALLVYGSTYISGYWMINFATASIIGFLLSFVFRLFNFSMLAEMVRSKE